MSQQPSHQNLGRIYPTRGRIARVPDELPELPMDPQPEGYNTMPTYKVVKPSDGIYYTQYRSAAPQYPEDYSSSSTTNTLPLTGQPKRHRVSMQKEEPEGLWILPHPKSSSNNSFSESTGTSRYVTPGGRYLNKIPKKHTAGTQFVGVEQVIPGQPAVEEFSLQDIDELNRLTSLANRPSPIMTVTFRYDANVVDSSFDNELLIRLQAQCRAYLAKLEKRRRLKEDDAVRCIQKNASLYFDPWVRLFLALRPCLKRHRLEDEIIQLKGELEKFKAMVKVLRYENVAYQDKIARLLQLLDQMNPGGASGDLITNLVKELSMAVTDHQKQWQTMVAGIPQNELGIVGRIPPITGGSGIPTDTLTDYQQARDNAEFYRNQLEMLREEVDDQNTRTSQHYEEKIGVLSERVEQLQNLLTQESFRVDRLNVEIEAANSQLNEARDNESNLNSLIEQLKKEFNRGRMASLGSPMIEENLITAKVADAVYATAPLEMSDIHRNNFEQINDQQQGSAMTMLESIRNYLEENPSVYEILKDTPLGDGGDLDILSPKTTNLLSKSNGYLQDKYATAGSFGTLSGFENPSMSSVYHNQSHVENYNISKQSDSDTRLDKLQQKLDDEVGYREDLEMEAQEMRNRIAKLTRQLRKLRDEHEEEIVEKDQASLRRIRELDDNVDELIKERETLQQRCTELQSKLDGLRKSPDLSDNDDVTEELRGNHAKVVAENRRYQRELEELRDEFEKYRLNNNVQELKEQLDERNEKISQVEVQHRHLTNDMEIMAVRLQNANSLLEDNEQRLRVATKERQSLMHRISQLESERDAAVREAATSVGRAGAERESALVKAREFEQLREERDLLRRDLIDTKVVLTEASTKALAEKAALEKRLVDFGAAADKKEIELKTELERYREHLESLQQEVSELQKQESVTKTDNRHLKRQVTELQDSVDIYTRKVAELERRSSDLLAELDRAKANLSAARETASLLRDRQTRANEECSMVMSNQDDIQFSDDDDTNDYNYDNNTVQTLDRHRPSDRNRKATRSASRTLSQSKAKKMPQYGSYRSVVSKAPPLPVSDNSAASTRRHYASETVFSDGEVDATNTLNETKNAS